MKEKTAYLLGSKAALLAIFSVPVVRKYGWRYALKPRAFWNMKHDELKWTYAWLLLNSLIDQQIARELGRIQAQRVEQEG